MKQTHRPQGRTRGHLVLVSLLTLIVAAALGHNALVSRQSVEASARPAVASSAIASEAPGPPTISVAHQVVPSAAITPPAPPISFAAVTREALQEAVAPSVPLARPDEQEQPARCEEPKPPGAAATDVQKVPHPLTPRSFRPSGTQKAPGAAPPPPPAPVPPAETVPPAPHDRDDADPSAAGDNTRADTSPRRMLIRDQDGRVLVARAYGPESAHTVLLPDGQLGLTKGTSFTSEPFVIETADEIAARLTAGEYKGFAVETTEHYVVLYQSRGSFAKASAHLLESLYQGLIAKLRSKDLDVHDAEFPLVAIIFRNEKDFRAHSDVPPDCQAYYDVFTNRIHLYDQSERDVNAPDIVARRRPQTVAHEGTHQVLQNIGLHPRLANWPPWLVEGLAEYFAPTTLSRDGSWDGANKVNPFHIATIRDMRDPLAVLIAEKPGAVPRLALDPHQSLVEYVVTRTQLTPTDYAYAWALTHYLANKRFDDFLAYLQDLSHLPPGSTPRPVSAFLAEFRSHFDSDLTRFDKSFKKYLDGMKHFESLPYYAVSFEQPLRNGYVRRAAMVSQSLARARQWVDEMAVPEGGVPAWRAQPFPTRTRAQLAAEQWVSER